VSRLIVAILVGAGASAVLFAVATSDASRIWGVLGIAVAVGILAALLRRVRGSAARASSSPGAGGAVAPRPTGGGRRIARRALLLTAGLGGAAVVAWPIRDEVAAQARVLPFRHDLSDYVRGPGRAETAIEAFIVARGDPTVTDVVVYPRYVLFTAPTSPGASTYDSFQVRGGRLTRTGPSSIQPDAVAEFSVEDIAWGAIPALHEQLGEAMQADGGELGGARRQAGVQRSSRDGGPTRISVLLYDAYRDGTLIADQDGTVLEIS